MPRNVPRFDPFAIRRFDPLAELDALQRRFFGDVVGGVTRATSVAPTVSVPTTDVYTEGDRFVVESHLPNFGEKDVEISLDDDALTIQGQKQDRDEDNKKKRYVVRETSQSFYRRVPLPERVDESQIAASFQNGVLKVVIPFKELPAPKRIPINLGSNESEAQSSSDDQSTP